MPFIGAVNATVRNYLATIGEVFSGAPVVVGCSGNFTSEAVISQHARPASIHSNDISLYSCMAGRWLTGQPVDFALSDPSLDWLAPYLDTDARRLASLMVLLDMLPFEKQNNAHRLRMWRVYRESFGDLITKTTGKLGQVGLRLTSFHAGDVFDHFRRFEDDQKAVFCCYAPTYAGGYERMYKRLEAAFAWDKPTYTMLDDKRRDELLAWMTERRFLWYDDRLIDGMEPAAVFRTERKRAVYLYSNLTSPAYVANYPTGGLPNMPLAGGNLELTTETAIRLVRIKTTDLARFKDAFLGKNIDFGQGMWGMAVLADGQAIGFIELNPDKYTMDGLYMMADFAVPGTPYARLSKLIVMLVVSGETRRLMERVAMLRTRSIATTAFTDRPVSMKYRGVFDLTKRGETVDGQKFLNYEAKFNDLTWKETYLQWLNKNGSKRS